MKSGFPCKGEMGKLWRGGIVCQNTSSTELGNVRGYIKFRFIPLTLNLYNWNRGNEIWKKGDAIWFTCWNQRTLIKVWENVCWMPDSIRSFCYDKYITWEMLRMEGRVVTTKYVFNNVIMNFFLFWGQYFHIQPLRIFIVPLCIANCVVSSGSLFHNPGP